MTLYDLMLPAMSHQIFHVYVTNKYDQNIEIGRGRRCEIVNEEITAMGIDHLMDKVDFWKITKDGSMVVVLINEHFEERAETQYDEDYVAKWDNLKPETRPWKHLFEL